MIMNPSTTNSNSNNSNIFKNKNESDFHHLSQLKTKISIENYQNIKQLKLTFWRYYDGTFTKIKEQTIDNPNSNVYLFDDTIKSANNEPGKYFYTCTLINKNNQTKDLYTLSYYLNIFENDASDFKLEKYFNQNLAK